MRSITEERRAWRYYAAVVVVSLVAALASGGFYIAGVLVMWLGDDLRSGIAWMLVAVVVAVISRLAYNRVAPARERWELVSRYEEEAS